ASMVCFETARRLAGRSRPGAVSLNPAPSFYSVALPAPLEGRLETPWAGPALVAGCILVSLALIGLTTLALALALATALAGLAALRWRSRETLFMCALGILALAALSVPEVVAIRGDVGRMNTVFKFYYQAW